MTQRAQHSTIPGKIPLGQPQSAHRLRFPQYWFWHADTLLSDIFDVMRYLPLEFVEYFGFFLLCSGMYFLCRVSAVSSLLLRFNVAFWYFSSVSYLNCNIFAKFDVAFHTLCQFSAMLVVGCKSSYLNSTLEFGKWCNPVVRKLKITDDTINISHLKGLSSSWLKVMRQYRKI